MQNQVEKVLIVEDDEDDVLLLKEMFCESKLNRGFEVINAVSLRQACGMLADEKFSLIITDLGLPDCRGIETYRQLKAMAEETPILVLTGLNDEDMGTQAIQEGAQDYLLKGQITADQLARSVRYAKERTELMRKILTREKSLYEAEKTAILNTLISGLTHNLNNPLFAISGKLQLFLRQKDTPEKFKSAFVQLLEQLNRIVSIQKDLVYLIKSDTPHNEEVDLTGIAKRAIAYIDSLSIDKKIATEVALEEACLLLGNASEIHLALVYILANAVDAIDKEGTITVVSRKKKQRCIIEIGDSGSGMPEEVLKRMYDPFFSTKDGKASRGLGLSVVRRIVSRHQGEIRIESDAGKGTKVTLIFPGLPTAAPPGTPQAPSGQA